MFNDLKRICLETCVLFAFGALFGLTLHHQLVMDAFSGRLAPEQQPVREGAAPTALPVPVMISEVQQRLAAGSLIVDARSPDLYAMGHIDGAISLPLADIENLLPEFLNRVAEDRVIITYCSGFGCPDSFDLGLRLIESGYRNILVFEGGFPEWRDAGLPVTGGDR
jgi:rhodanese-related sulfurtransferase